MKNVMMHDGSWVKFRKLAKDYDPTNRAAAYAHIRDHQRKGEVVTGLLDISADSQDVHDQNDTVPGSRPGSAPMRRACRLAIMSRRLVPPFASPCTCSSTRRCWLPCAGG